MAPVSAMPTHCPRRFERPCSAAANAGIRERDVIIAVDGDPLADVAELTRERMRAVVAGHQQQSGEHVANGVDTAGPHAA